MSRQRYEIIFMYEIGWVYMRTITYYNRKDKMSLYPQPAEGTGSGL